MTNREEYIKAETGLRQTLPQATKKKKGSENLWVQQSKQQDKKINPSYQNPIKSSNNIQHFNY